MESSYDKAPQGFRGLMLGDGGLWRYRDDAYYFMNQSKRYTPIDLMWEQWIADNIFSPSYILVSEGFPKPVLGEDKGKPIVATKLLTRRSPLLGSLCDEGYVGGRWIGSMNNKHIVGKTKIVPRCLMETLELPTPDLVHWYLGDGGIGWDFDKKTPVLRMSLHTQCFTEEEVYHLTAMLNGVGIVTNKPGQVRVRKGSGLYIKVSAEGYDPDRLSDKIEPMCLEIFGTHKTLLYEGIVVRKSDFEDKNRALIILKGELERRARRNLKVDGVIRWIRWIVGPATTMVLAEVERIRIARDRERQEMIVRLMARQRWAKRNYEVCVDPEKNHRTYNDLVERVGLA